jgi:tRNA U34 2-thiouridine synthase MnmA/TrmU
MHGLQPVPVLSNPRYPVSLIGTMTGHYARKAWDTSDHMPRPRPMLRKPLDATKDQTYYLSSISENSLSRALFPLSQLTKAQVRHLAHEWHLPTATRDESMGLCFVGERKKFSEFICQFRILFIVTSSDLFQHNTSYPSLGL